MRYLPVVVASCFALILINVSFVSADPRMEINDNFCHAILDTDDTDNEVFVSECSPSLVVNTIEAADLMVEKDTHMDTTCTYKKATGFASVIKIMPEATAPLPATTELIYTSGETTSKCTMVDSNGTKYKSVDWISRIKVSEQKEGYVRVIYEVTCFDGEA